jgi:anti-sigma factor RsiW
MRLLIQADIDGELQPAEAARMADHAETCPTCAQVQRQLMALSRRVKEQTPRHRAPELLRSAVRTKVLDRRSDGRAPRGRWFTGGLSAGLALAACLAVFTILPRGNTMPDWIVAAHIRALQPDHLVDVVSTDQHTVKPWFAGRLPFAPPVKDLAPEGFVLAGGRLDYLPGNTAATLIYRRRQHVIDLFIWPSAGDEDRASASGVREGYNYIRWRAGGMAFWAVSDLNAQELSDFSRAWH